MPLSGSHMQLKFRKLSNLLNVSTNLKYKNTFFPRTITKKPRNAISSTARLRRYINVNQLKFRNCKTLVNQSFLSESTGLEVAASQLRSVTISIVTAITISRDNANTHQWTGV